MKRKKEKGVAMVLALVLLLIMSVMAISLMFISQTETWASMNYRLMDQARDGAEAGINAAANYLINSYTPPASTGSDLLSNYTMTVSPVTYSGSAVVLPSNYPVSSVKTAFNGMAQGSLANGNTTVNYNATATLLSQAQFTPWGTSTPTTVQTWKITSDGTVGGLRSADEQVSAILEKQVTPVFTYAAFATAQGCGALQFGGGGTTDSYDSSALVAGSPSITNADGNIGTNGNLSTNGSKTTINGSLSTPKTGVGSCSSSNVTAWTDSNGTVTGGLVDLPQTVTYPNPSAPNPTPPTSTATLNNHAGDCSGVSGSGSSTGCTFGVSGGCTAGDFCLAPGTCPATSGGAVTGGGVYGDITVKGNVHLTSGCYNIDSFTENGGGTLIIDSGPVVINVAGSGGGTVMDLTGGGVINNAGWSPQMLQIMYAGTGSIAVKGGANATALLYAPNASFSFNSAGGNWYGALIVGQMTDMGGATVNYDRNLQKTAVTIGNWMLDSFTWSKQ